MTIHKAMSLGIATAVLGLAAGCGSPGSTPNTTQDATPNTTASRAPSSTPSPSLLGAEAVFRQFLDATNASNATRAASLVAEDATFFGEAGSPIDLVRSLECTAEIVSVDDSGGTLDVELRFTGTTAWHSECDLEGTTLPVVVSVRDGKIVDLRDR